MRLESTEVGGRQTSEPSWIVGRESGIVFVGAVSCLYRGRPQTADENLMADGRFYGR